MLIPFLIRPRWAGQYHCRLVSHLLRESEEPNYPCDGTGPHGATDAAAARWPRNKQVSRRTF